MILELNGEEENESLLIEENHNDKGKDSREKKKSEIMLISISLETKKVMKEEQLQSLFKKNINITDLGLNTIQRQDINLCYFYSYVSSTRRNDNVEAKNDLTIE